MKEGGHLFSHNNRGASLHEPLSGCPCLLIHHLAEHLSRKCVSINRLRFFYTRSLTQQSIAQELLQGTQTLLLVELSYLDETFKDQTLSQSRPSHQ